MSQEIDGSFVVVEFFDLEPGVLHELSSPHAREDIERLASECFGWSKTDELLPFYVVYNSGGEEIERMEIYDD